MTTKKFCIVFSLFFLSFALFILGCQSFVQERSYEPGIYHGTGYGYRGPIYVRLQISAAGIEDIVITGHREGSYPGAAAMEELLEELLETGSIDVDVVSGATFSSLGFLEAVEDALGQALFQAQKPPGH